MLSRYDSVACYSSSSSKTSFRKGAASDVEIGRSRWVSGRGLSKVGETAALIWCPWLRPVQLKTCAPEHYHAATAVRLSVWLVSCYAHVFVQLSVVIVTLP